MDEQAMKESKLVRSDEKLVELSNGCICCTRQGAMLDEVRKVHTHPKAREWHANEDVHVSARSSERTQLSLLENRTTGAVLRRHKRTHAGSNTHAHPCTRAQDCCHGLPPKREKGAIIDLTTALTLHLIHLAEGVLVRKFSAKQEVSGQEGWCCAWVNTIHYGCQQPSNVCCAWVHTIHSGCQITRTAGTTRFESQTTTPHSRTHPNSSTDETNNQEVLTTPPLAPTPTPTPTLAPTPIVPQMR